MKREFYYDIPSFSPDKDGNIIFLYKYSMGPIESFKYGVSKDNQYFLDWEYPIFGDDELENDYRIISGERLIRALKNEIDVCILEGNNELVEKFREGITRIETRQRKDDV